MANVIVGFQYELLLERCIPRFISCISSNQEKLILFFTIVFDRVHLFGLALLLKYHSDLEATPTGCQLVHVHLH